MPLSPLATTPGLASPLTQAEPRAGAVAFTEEDSWNSGPQASDFSESLRDAQESDCSECQSMEDSEATDATASTSEAAIQADPDQDWSESAASLSDEPADDPVVNPPLEPVAGADDAHTSQSSSTSGDGVGVSRDGANVSSATVGFTKLSVPAPVISAAPAQTQGTVAQPTVAAPVLQKADQSGSPAAATTTPAMAADSQQVHVAVGSLPRAVIDATRSSDAPADGAAASADEADQSAVRLRATQPSTIRRDASEQPANESQPASERMSNPKPMHVRAATEDAGAESGAIAQDAKPVESAKLNAAKAARSLHLQAAGSVDSARGGDAPATPATARAAQVDQAIRLENALANGTQATSDAASAKSSVAAPASPTAALVGASSDVTTLMGRTSVSDEADVPALFSSQAIRGLTAMVNQRGGSMMLRLDPPELGMLRVQMKIVGGNVTAEFTAAAQQTQTLLDRSMVALRQSLESQGLTVERLTVHPATASSHSNQASTRHDDGGGGGPNQQQSWANQHDAGGSESRGRRDETHDQSNAWNRFASHSGLFESLLGADELLAAAGAGVDS